MFYGRTLLATDWGTDPWQVKVIRTVLFFIPAANPDNEKQYPLVKEWCLEVDESGRPMREIGLGSNGEPLFGAPDERNYGFWTDGKDTDTLQKEDLSPLSKDEFERLWHEVQVRKDASNA